ncbi:MAG TPA: hypothetical protein VEU32_08995 [Burkholderiales bacterium]|nr:hypothetical protein [Burkholderiales bacterium]
MDDERDPRLTKHYRELEPLEPPRELDRKILAAAREAAVRPAGRHRWYYSLAAAATLVFAVALTLHVERERPDAEMSPTASVRGEIKPATPAESKPAATAQAKSADSAREEIPRFAPDPQAAAAASRTEALRSEAPQMRAEQAERRAERAAAEPRAAADQAKAMAMPSRAAGAPPAAPENPARWLERIAELRSRGRHAEADRELAAFRKAYPDYPLSNVMRERVEGTPAPAAQ